MSEAKFNKFHLFPNLFYSKSCFTTSTNHLQNITTLGIYDTTRNKLEKKTHAEKLPTSKNYWACNFTCLLWFPSFGEEATETSQKLFSLEACEKIDMQKLISTYKRSYCLKYLLGFHHKSAMKSNIIFFT